MKSAFKYGGPGCSDPYAEQDPDEDLDWPFDFADAQQGPVLETGEAIAVAVFHLTRIDGAALTTETVHHTDFANNAAVAFVAGLILWVDYRLECNITTNNVPPRKYSRSFRLLCRTK